MLRKFRSDIVSNVKNIPGWRTGKKIVVFECDDWGGIRMPSKKAREQMAGKGLKVTSGRFNNYDTLETARDLEQLFEVLSSVKDINQRYAVMTPLTIVANPDFEKIRSCGFTQYYYEPFTVTLKHYYADTDVFKIWKQGINEGIFAPELHGREHITTPLWMEKLREGNEELHLAFDHGFVSLDIPGIPLPANEFRAEFYFTSENQKQFLEKSIQESVILFRDIFGYMPRVFVPGNGIFHPDFDKAASKAGIQFLNVFHSMPYPVNRGELKYRHFITGQKGPGGMIYYTRNCAFEPNMEGYSGIDSTLRQMTAAFRWGKPANISTHRVNYTGGLEPANRENGLKELKKLLNAIIRKWPDAEFMSSAEALNYMRKIT
jgi:hypothetical protein